ncbi:hypothetical protein BpHYR1_010625 [Brachionus plicatilis]|uniref:Uncharacterized protein n=1 Tax=Brachionus plicatilis TaxID=10195 RepID=A0A3M7S6N6_BRAPC|nr:hypothetical protein BpHYR1_010625 [Brachionus plicatilis]
MNIIKSSQKNIIHGLNEVKKEKRTFSVFSKLNFGTVKKFRFSLFLNPKSYLQSLNNRFFYTYYYFIPDQKKLFDEIRSHTNKWTTARYFQIFFMENLSLVKIKLFVHAKFNNNREQLFFIESSFETHE